MLRVPSVGDRRDTRSAGLPSTAIRLPSMGPIRAARRPARTAATVLAITLAVLVPGTALAAPGTAPPAPGDPGPTVADATAAVTAAAQEVADAERAAQRLSDELRADEATIAAVAAQVSADQREASALVAAAKRQVIAGYVRTSAGNEASLVAALSRANGNDAAWSLGVLRIANKRTIGMSIDAARRQGASAGELVSALARRDRVVQQLTAVSTTLTQARSALGRAEATLGRTLVTRVAPATIEGMTTVAYDAYRRAAAALALERPSCGVRWELLAAIGRTESNHGSGRLDRNGDTRPKIVGIPIGPDTDGGALDGDSARDRAVGPMQFIPSTWVRWASDGNGDGRNDIDNLYDESLAAARYLCAAAGELTLRTRDGVVRGILAYNPNQEYLRTVGGRFEALAQDVAAGWFSVADLPDPADDRPGDAVSGGTPPPDTPTAAPAPTAVVAYRVFDGASMLVPVLPGAPTPARCDAASSMLAGRPGILRCTLAPAVASSPAPVLDPCVVSPADPTLAACVPDPEQPVRLVRSATVLPIAVVSSGPPYQVVVLAGGDRCRPLPRATTPDPAPPAVATATTTPGTTTPGTTTPGTTTPGTTTPGTTTPGTTTPGTTSAITTAPSTTAPGTTSTTTTAPSTTAPSTTSTTSAPVAVPTDGVTYRCGSGAEIEGQPDRSRPTWTVVVRQPGISARTVALERVVD
jgi:hypothetical protein